MRHIFVKPSSETFSSGSSAFWRLPHPRTGLPALFFVERQSLESEQVLELQEISSASSRSWFLGDHVLEDGRILLCTPIDPAFLLIPILTPTFSPDGTAGTFRPVDDLLEDAISRLPLSQSHNDVIMKEDVQNFVALASVRDCLGLICDSREINAELVVFRPSSVKILDYCKRKVSHIASSPTFHSSRTVLRTLSKDGILDDGMEHLVALGHTREACNLLSQYLSPELLASLTASYDFTLLDQHMKSLQPNTETVSSKPKKSDAGAGGKRKPSKGSHGVEKLKKVNTSGMAKLSTFFTRVEPAQ